MKTFLLLVLGVLLALIVVDRRRIYVRDPLATVYKSDLHQGGKTNARQSGKSSLRQSGKSSLRQSGTPNQSQDVVTESMQSAMEEQVQSGGVIVPQQSGNSGKSQNAAAELLQISKATGQLQSGVSGVLRASKVEQVQSEVSGLLQKVDPDLLQGSGKDGKQSGVQVFVNASGDVLLWQDAEPGAYRILVQGWNKAPGTPVRLTCLHWMVCLTDADHPTTLPIDGLATAGGVKGSTIRTCR